MVCLLDELHIHIAPLLLGEGVTLFGHFDSPPIKLKSSGVVETPGAVHIKYEIIK